MGLPLDGSERWASPSLLSIKYLIAPPAKFPEALGSRFEPKSLACKTPFPWGFWDPESQEVDKKQENTFPYQMSPAK